MGALSQRTRDSREDECDDGEKDLDRIVLLLVPSEAYLAFEGREELRVGV